MKIIQRKQKTPYPLILSCFMLVLAFPLVLPAPAAQDPIFASEVSAKGRREHLVKVNRWGRYIVKAKSAEGVSVEVVDKLRGTFASAGQAGESDGQVEVFLEAGYYKVFTAGPEDAKGQVYVTVDRFAPVSPADISGTGESSAGAPADLRDSRAEAAKTEYLEPFKQTAAALASGEVKFWWIFVPRDTLVYIEAMGRHLSSMAVFRGGEWLVKETKGNDAFVNAAAPQKPLNGLRIYERLERGKHLIAVYGNGKADRYTVDDDSEPLYMQWMLTPVERNQQITASIGSSGRNSYVVSRDVIIESLDGEILVVEGYTLMRNHIMLSYRDSAHISRTGAVIPVIGLPSSSSDLLYICGKPGSRYRMTTVIGDSEVDFRNYSPPEDGVYQLTTLHTGFGGGNVGASGLLVDMKDSSIVALKADTVSAASPLRREFVFSMRGRANSYLWINEAGTYTVVPGGDAAFDWHISKFFITAPRGYTQPDAERGRLDIALDRGLYVIRMNAVNMGKASFTIFAGSAKNINPDKIKASAPNPSITFRPLALKKDRTYRFYPNFHNPEYMSFNIEKFPREKFPGPDDKSIAEMYIKDEAAEREEAGTPKMERLKLGSALYTDIKRNELKTYVFTITEPGIYKIETTGRLHTKLTARDRFNGLMFGRSGDGVVRNAMITEYFLPGNYVLTAESINESAGRMGILLSSGALRAGGRLEDGVDRRVMLDAHEAVVYDLAVGRKDRYRLESFTQSYEPFQRIRLEGADGWPLFRHGESAPQEVELEKGSYKLYSLPLTHDNFRVTRAQIIEGPTEFTGKDTSTVLFAGISRGADAPQTMRVRVDSAGVYEIFSQGRPEILACLYGADGTTEIARGAGGYQDWNFVISERLDSGMYNLQLTDGGFFPRGLFPSSLATKIFMRRVEDTLMQAVKLNVPAAGKAVSARDTAAHSRISYDERKISLTGKQAVIPIEPLFGDILIINAVSDSRIIAELESSSKSAAGRQQGKKIKMSVPFEKGAKYTLRIWAEDRNSGEVNLVTKTVESIPLTYEKALSGVYGTAIKDLGKTAYYRIDDMPAPPSHYELISAPIGSTAPGRASAGNAIVRVSGVNSAGTVFSEEEGSLIPTAGKRLWLQTSFHAEDRYRFVLSPVLITDAAEIAERNKRKFETADRYRFSRNQVKYPEREELPVAIRANREKIFEIDTPSQKLGIVSMTMISGQPLAGLSTSAQRADFVRGGIPVLGGQYIGERLCLTAVLPGDTGRIAGWNAEADGSLSDGVSGSFTMRNFSAGKADTLRVGRTMWRAKASLAGEYYIQPDRARTVTVKLSPHTGFVYVSADGIRDMYYGGDNGTVHTLNPDCGKLFLFGLADGGEAGDIEMEMYASSPPSARSDVLTTGGEISTNVSVDTKEIIRIKNEAPAAARLFFSGAIDNIDRIDRSGQITRSIKDGAAVTGEGGALLVSRSPGGSKIRLCRDDGSALGLNECRWGDTVKKWDEAPVVKEMSKLTLADGVNWYSIELTEAAHISLTAPVPAAAIIAVDGRVRDYEEFWDGLEWDIPLAPGKFTIGLKPLSGKPLTGAPLTVGFYPISALTEDKPLSLHLMSGQKRMVRFDLPQKSRVGLGLSASKGTAEAVLLDAWGRSTGTGRQIFTELEKGAYHVLLSTPPTGPGSATKLHLFGQTPPPADPPEALIKWITGGGAGPRP
ncbi:MAG: hypothetical protein FWB94_05050 [Chitinispirillia bacterium]|nr:hypothetical protein [Chitinispirillia bacterium]